MPRLKYKAANLEGKIQRGSLEAVNNEDLELRLSRMGLVLIQAEKIETQRHEIQRELFNRDRATRKTLILFCVYMEQLLRSGIAIPLALEEIRSSTPHPSFRDVITSMIEDINSGKTLSAAMQAYPNVFPSIFPGLIQVGEKTGTLEDVFENLGNNLKWEDELLAQTRKAMRYPMIVGSMVLALFFFLMTYLTPRLIGFLPQMGAEIPMHTRVLIALSDFVIFWWPLILFIPIATYVGTKIGCRISPSFHLKRDRLQLRLWFFGPLLYKVHLVRFSNAFALMYRSGVSILDAMEMTGSVSGNKALQTTIMEAKQMVSDGQSVSASFQETNLFPAPIPRLLQVGEKAGQLDKALLNASYFFDREVRESIGNIQSMVEPILTLFVGTLLGWVIVSVLGPIYDIITKVQF